MKAPNVVIRTRFTHAMMTPVFLLPLFWIAFMKAFPWMPFTIELVVSSVMISMALFLIAREFMSESEVARVENDTIVFNSRRAISFDDLKSFSFEDGLTLRVKGKLFPLHFQCHSNPQGYSALIDELRMAFSERRKTSQSSGAYMPRQKFFYGTWKTRLIGYGATLSYAYSTVLFAKYYLY